MSIAELLLTAVALSMDAVAVSLSCGMAAEKLSPKQMFRVAFAFGLFQAVMPALGFLMGSGIRQYIAAVDHWIAFGLLVFIGGRMLWEQWKNWKDDSCEVRDLTTFSNLMVMAFATSIDALAVGIGLAMTDVALLPTVLTIGAVTFALSLAALLLGRRVGCVFSKYAGVLGGLILIGIGINILVGHMTGGA